MKDFDGKELVIGDTVAFLEPHYRHMVKGRVVDFTKAKIRIEYEYPRTGYYQGQLMQCLREPSYVAKILDQSV